MKFTSDALAKSLFFATFSLMALFILGCTPAAKQVHLTGQTMGTYYSIKYIEQNGLPKQGVIQQQIDARLAQVNSEMSTYQKNSQLSRFNRSLETTAFPVSQNTATVIAEAIRLHQLTEGALDITVGPLVNLWGFGPSMRIDKKPTAAEIATAREATGMDLIRLNESKISKKNPQVYVDLSSIAKGFAVDYLADYLSELHIDNFLVEIGGELQLKGNNAQNQPWRIAVEKPIENEHSVQLILAPKDKAVATSGDYRNYFEQEGVRYSHVIDPKTAKPIEHHLVSVTIIDNSCMTADGLATAFMVLGEKKGLELANKENIAAFFIVKTQEGFKEMASNAFKPYLDAHK